ncbi:cupin-like domain-containing protein [Dichotomopilus funicola]|uniref:Cupin-like domain-containing protein n=1 Tax=Dichotomopilus funicola TaxID=1934379 RepID=A0AAN6ZPQ5_9PEZI|nr:cupin-like domain-containing protein [Dichotomopilus funicola]
MDEPKSTDPIAELITRYHDLTGNEIEELREEPSPLQFMRYVARNVPFVLRGGARSWYATRSWSVDKLKESLGDQPVNIAVTAAGNADAPTSYTHPDGTTSLVLAKPHEEPQPFSTFIDYLIAQEHQQTTDPTQPPRPPPTEIRYAQTQDNNLQHEYVLLSGGVPPDIPWARIALQLRKPDATNLWIGNSHSVTALHHDNYENIYAQIAGRKHFVLLPPACVAGVNEQMLPLATYVRKEGEGGGFELVIDRDEDRGGVSTSVPWAIWDPDRPMENATAYSSLVEPMRVTLEPGDMLYLPALWYHKVSQSCSPEGVCIAVNYWYDMEYHGSLYPLAEFARSIAHKERLTTFSRSAGITEEPDETKLESNKRRVTPIPNPPS